MKLYFVVATVALAFVQSTIKAQSNISTDSLVQLVKEAYIYGYPVEQSYRMYVTLPDNTGQTKTLYNHFSYADKLVTAAVGNTAKVAAYKATRNRGGAGPNNDTPYFGSLLDFGDEPIVLSIPNFGNRYFSFQFLNFCNENVQYIGSSFGDTVGTTKGFNWYNYDVTIQQRVHSTLVQTDSLLDAEGASGDLDFGNGWQRTNPKVGHWGNRLLGRSFIHETWFLCRT